MPLLHIGRSAQIGRVVLRIAQIGFLFALLPFTTAHAEQDTASEPADVLSPVTATLKPGPGAVGSSVGYSIATSADGSTVVALAPSNTATGKASTAYVFVRSGTNWKNTTHRAQLRPSESGNVPWFGTNVAISANGSVIAIEGVSYSDGPEVGSVYVYVRPSGGWTDVTESARLRASDADQDTRLVSVAISGDGSTIMAARYRAYIYNSIGAYVFSRPTGGWTDATETAKLGIDDSTSSRQTPTTVSISADGSTVGLGITERFTTSASGIPIGAVYVYTRPTTGWGNANQSAILTTNNNSANRLGQAITMSNDGSLIAAGMTQDGAINRGAAYMYTRPVAGWADATESAVLHASDSSEYALFGSSLDLSADGRVLVVGAPGQSDNNIFGNGAAYVFYSNSGAWASGTEAAKLVRPNAPTQSDVGRDVATSDDGASFFVGAPLMQEGEKSGAVYVFQAAMVVQFRTYLPMALE